MEFMKERIVKCGLCWLLLLVLFLSSFCQNIHSTDSFNDWDTKNNHHYDSIPPSNSQQTETHDGIMDMNSILDTILQFSSPFEKEQSSYHYHQREPFDLFSSVKVIPDQKHVSAFFNRGSPKRLIFLNEENGNPLSITVTPCTSILLWSIKFVDFNTIQGGFDSNRTKRSVDPIKTFRTQRTISFKERSAKRGIYFVDIRSIYSDSYVHLYATSNDLDTPYPYDYEYYNNYKGSMGYSHYYHDIGQGVRKERNTDKSNYYPSSSYGIKPRIKYRTLSGNRVKLNWDTSFTNPHLMQYCIVINTRRDYSSLCGAQGERFGVLPPDLMHVSYYNFIDKSVFQRSKKSFAANEEDSKKTYNDIIIGCLNNKRTSYVLSNLEEGRLYYFNVFLKNFANNLSYPFVRTTVKYVKPQKLQNGLQNSKPIRVKLKEDLGATKTLKFNLKNPCSELTFYSMPCGGGLINFQVYHLISNQTRSIYSSSKSIEALEIVKIAFPHQGRYLVKILQSPYNGPNTMARMAEVFVSKKNDKFPLPKLPANTKIWEDESKRDCDSVTIEWWPSPDPKDNEYCFFFKEDSRKKEFNFKKPIQCDVERNLKSDPYVTQSLCLQRNHPKDSQTPLNQKISGLYPGKIYIVQLIVRKHKGKSLSYDLMAVSTSDSYICLEEK